MNVDIGKLYQGFISRGVRFGFANNDLVIHPMYWRKKYQRIISRYKYGLAAIHISQSENQKINDFKKSIAKSDNAFFRPFLESIYHKAFNDIDFIHWTANGDTISQNRGIDVIIYLKNDKIIRIEEKLRFRNYGDIALEYVSSDNANTAGWIKKDLATDYLCYVILPTQQAYILPWQLLRKVWLENHEEWLKLAKTRKEGFSHVSAPNYTYNTLSCGVPVDLLLNKMKESMLVE